MRIRVLFVNEFSCHNSGYAKYGMEVIKRLAKCKDIQIAELACYASEFNPKDVERANQLPWDVYFNQPDLNNPEHLKDYQKKKTNQWGEYKFNQVVLQFKPHIVMDIRDFWMGQFIEESPLRNTYNRVIMAPVDSYPQSVDWIYSYSKADGVFTYTDWGKQILEKQAGKNINLLGTASPAASDFYSPKDKRQAKDNFGLRTDIKIIGTIMRNQSRKLFPDLFRAFREYLDRSKRPDIFLYCHTAYPDKSWEIPQLLKEYNIASRTLFTYKCHKCGHCFPNYYQGMVIFCPKCNQCSAAHPKVENGATEEELSNMLCCFDLYVQYMGLEGFGMVLPEAGMAGIPIVGVQHTSLEDVLPKTGGDGIKPISYNTEPISMRQWAVPDNEGLVNYLMDFFSAPLPNRSIKGKMARETSEKNYNWDDTANKWYEYFKTVDVMEYEDRWKIPRQLRSPEGYDIGKNVGNADYVRWLIEYVLCDREQLYSFLHLRLLKDLNMKGLRGREMAYRECLYLCNEFNKWESLR